MNVLDCPRPTSGLTRFQAALRDYLRARSGQAVSRGQLCLEVWGMKHFPSSRTIDQTISILRKHLEADERIHTVFGIGYRHEFLRPMNAKGRNPQELAPLQAE